MEPVYFDNAATSWPKPGGTIEAITRYNSVVGGNPGRSGHRLSVEAGRIMLDTRDLLAELFNIGDPFQIVFQRNATAALNLAIFGLAGNGGHIITSGMEHNSVMRPLRCLEKNGAQITVVPCSEKGELDPDLVRKAIRPDTRAIIMTHASNVTGTIMPVKEVGQIAREQGIPFCVDSAQSAGALPVDVEAMNISLLAFTGHKSLFGPQGTGGLYIKKGMENLVPPREMGGTGSRSEFEEQPDFMPDMYESGTPNTIGIAGLGAGVDFILKQGIENIRRREVSITRQFLEGAEEIPGIKIFGPDKAQERTSVVSFNIEGASPSEVSERLDEEFLIMSRPGLHCAPSAHATIGTFPTGTVRFSFGYFTSAGQIDHALNAVRQIAGEISRTGRIAMP